ncbi:MAG TPA: alpha/beta fold hydrolase [Solirubrobacter sp.]|nr:alpha/beta fold hydrolase [Solirubrobacter sp.]
MATFVLVHGAWHGGWCWRDVATELRAAGHDVHTPTLSGCGEKARLAPHVDLSVHVDELANLLYFADLREVVLVGHSYGGLPVTGAAARFGARIARLVYLDAFVADDGQSLLNLLRPERRKYYEESAADGLVPAPSPETLGVVEQADWLRDRLTPQPLKTFTEPLSASATPPVPRTYIRCTQGPMTPSFSGFAVRFRDTAGWDVVDFDSGHDAMITRPLDLAALLAT